MIQEIAELGYMAVTGGPAILKWVPKQAAGKVVLAVAKHYLQSGDYLQDAMVRATSQALDAIAIGLRPQWWRRTLLSRVGREFVADFQSSFLDPFMQENSVPTRDGFCREGSQACRHILRHLEELIEPMIPTEDAVHQFWSEANSADIEGRKQLAEERMISRIQRLPGVSTSVLSFFQYNHLLLHTIQYFFRQRVAKRPEVAALLQELRSQTSLDNQASLQRELRQLQASLLGPFADNLGASFKDMQEKIGELQQTVLSKEQESLRNQQAMVARLEHLDRHIQQFSHQQVDLNQQMSELSASLSSWKQREATPGWFGPFVNQTNQLEVTKSFESPLLHQSLSLPLEDEGSEAIRPFHPATSNKAILLWMDRSGAPLRTHYLFLSPDIEVGRNSSSDLMLHWLPLPDPISADNPDWLHWQQPGQRHPCLSISGRHFTLQWEDEADGESIVCTDLSSRGTWVNGERLTKEKGLSLQHGDQIGVGGVLELRFHHLQNDRRQRIGWKLTRENNASGLEEYCCIKPFESLWVGTLPQAHIYCQTSEQEPLLFRLWHDETSLYWESEHAPVGWNLQHNEPQRCRQPQRWDMGDHVLWLFPPG